MNAHWILRLRKLNETEEFTNANLYCSNCHGIPIDTTRPYPLFERYCHNCGAHMIEEPSIEIKEYDNKGMYSWE